MPTKRKRVQPVFTEAEKKQAEADLSAADQAMLLSERTFPSSPTALRIAEERNRKLAKKMKAVIPEQRLSATQILAEWRKSVDGWGLSEEELLQAINEWEKSTEWEQSRPGFPQAGFMAFLNAHIRSGRGRPPDQDVATRTLKEWKLHQAGHNDKEIDQILNPQQRDRADALEVRLDSIRQRRRRYKLKIDKR